MQNGGVRVGVTLGGLKGGWGGRLEIGHGGLNT